MVVWVVLIVATTIQGSRLLRLFGERYPQIAQREIPYVFDNWRHPEKAIFWFRKRAVELLRNDPELWRERQRYVGLVVATLGFWVALGVTIVVLGIVMT
jgi:hypothetical protein